VTPFQGCGRFGVGTQGFALGYNIAPLQGGDWLRQRLAALPEREPSEEIPPRHAEVEVVAGHRLGKSL
jgi:hypothetical protein